MSTTTIDSSLLQRLQEDHQAFHYPTGRFLLRCDQLAPHVLLLRHGQVRLLAHDPLEGSFTLERLGPGALLGWASLLRAEPCETVIAMEPCQVVAIPAARFLDLHRNSPDLQQLCHQPASAELAEALLRWWHNDHPHHLPNTPAQLLRLLPTATPASVRLATAQELDDPQQRGPERLWIWSGHPEQRRLLSLDRSWAALDQLPPQPAEPAAREVTGFDPLLVESLPEAPAPGEPIDPATLGLPVPPAPPPLGPLPRVKGRPATALACLRRLGQLQRFPVPLDSLRLALEDCEQRLGGVTLQHIGQLVESIGLEARPLACPPSHFHRLEAPAVLEREGHFALLEAAGPKGWSLTDPSEGLLTLSLPELRRLWPEGVELMLVRQPTGAVVDARASRFDLAWFAEALRPYRGRLAVVLLTGFTQKLLELIFPLATLQIVDLVVGSGNSSLLAPIALVLGVTAVVLGVLGVLRELLLADLADRIDTNLGSQVVGHLFRLPLRFFDRRTVGDLASRLHDLQQVRQFLTDTAIGSVIDVVFIPILLAILFLLQPVLAWVVLAQVPLLILLNQLGGRLSERQLTRRNTAWSRSMGWLVEVLSAIRTVKSQNFASEARWEWLQRQRTYAAADYRLSRNRSLVKESSSTVLNIGKMTVFLVAAVLALRGEASVGAIFAVYLLSSGVTGPLVNLSRLWDQYRDARAAMAAVADVIGQPPEEAEGLQEMPLPQIQGTIRFRKVSFGYNLDNRRQLDRLDLAIEAGSFVGLVGLSGSGKSTVVQLIDALYRPSEGRIFIDDIDIAQVQLASLRRQIGFVPQDSILFDGTVLDNLRLNQPDAPLEAVVAAAQVACAHEFISDLPGGYLSRVGERGGGLSGGQKQRIAIARMVLQNPSLVILDEATSALDADTEKRVVQQLRRHFRGRTLLFVTHRLGNLRQADRILVMESGRVVEDGSWSELVAALGSFAALAKQQHELAGAAIPAAAEEPGSLQE
ncbi:peptidase domain-containing ABC transporter [Synechococcus sp. CBW1002]|uniref:peptidase domain-containing ABC transporter n=1 Tax=Synechococcus sp. CBW1002 TaxID=1353134 RepID=UPI0018CD78F1|nr:peptidase domain-containing ABC transporter [Synechococcus sp. CBW1002]QPN59089.1 peptidase domain-containing ABC transporter [Synechococcus sp. CBW1002]